MNRHEFMGGLREALTGEIPEPVIEENIRFYNSYISDEMEKGRSEADIFAELGDPRLIARTIAETWQSDDTSFDNAGQNYRSFDEGLNTNRGSGEKRGPFVSVNGRSFDTGKWYVRAIPIVILLLILFFVFWVFFGLLHLTLSILLSPVFWVIVLAEVLLGYLKRRR